MGDVWRLIKSRSMSSQKSCVATEDLSLSQYANLSALANAKPDLSIFSPVQDGKRYVLCKLVDGVGSRHIHEAARMLRHGTVVENVLRRQKI